MFKMAEFWVAIAFLVFVAAMLYYKVPSLITTALDARADGIRNELDAARKLREEAQQLLADYQRKQSQAEREAEAIIQQAKREASLMADEARKSLEISLERRSKMAEDKIRRAEEQALGEVRSKAVDAAVSAAETILKARVSGATGAGLIDQGIADLDGKIG